MAKVIQIDEKNWQSQLFFPHIEQGLSRESFLHSELGYIYQSIPWEALTKHFEPKKKKETRGKKPIFTTQGQLALMFLKSYSGLSDAKLIERFNSDYHYQYFCGIAISPGNEIKDKGLPSKIRSKLSRQLDIHQVQKILANYWKGYMKDTHVCLTDATCYETDMRYPTNVKLLWESCQWLHERMVGLCKQAKLRRPRNKYKEQQQKTLTYEKRKKKTNKEKLRRTKSLLYLLEKLLNQAVMVEQIAAEKQVTPSGYYYQKKAIIEKVLEQQQSWYITGEKPKDIIVSLAKTYIRPIVRGKETRRVEWGAKLNKLQVDGINFIEHLSFNAFHEGNRLKSTILLHRQLFGVCNQVSADAIYATNENRKYCSANHITTCFVRKGKAAKDEKVRSKMRSILSKERATRLEGSFGVEKEHYGLKKIRARSESTEILWIFFCIHTANAVEISKRIQTQKDIPKKKAA